MKYEVITASEKADIVKAVNDLLAKGWELQGGIAVGTASYNGVIYQLVYSQAIIKRDVEKRVI